MSEDEPGSAEEVGTVGEEAAKLLNALQDWAKESGGQQARGAASMGEGVAAGLRNLNEHISTGSEDCAYCPVCQVIHVVRTTSPEVRHHVVSAARSLLQAASLMLETQVPAASPDVGVQRIDLDED